MSYKGGTINVRGAEGQIYAGMTLMYIRITEPCKIIRDSVSVATQPSGSSIYVDIRKNGTATTDSIHVSDAAIEITTGQPVINGLYTSFGTLDSAQVVCAEGDVLYVVCTQVGSTYSGSDVLVQIRTS